MIATDVRERPILFSGEMVRAILDGRKTQMRRVVKPQPEFVDMHSGKPVVRLEGSKLRIVDCPYGAPGDRLWVRETWGSGDQFIYGSEQDPPRIVVYRADNAAFNYLYDDDGYFIETQTWNLDGVKWRPSIHMPRWASRITLEVTDVRVQRVQDISREDAIAEGVFGCEEAEAAAAGRAVMKGQKRVGPVEYFRELWDSINAHRGYSWESNCWVWCISFRRIR